MANFYSWNNPWQNYGRHFGKNYDDMMSTNLSMKHEPNAYVPTIDKIGRTVLSGLYAGIKSGFDSDTPSAVIGSNGINSVIESVDMPARGRGRGRRQPLSKKAKAAKKRAVAISKLPKWSAPNAKAYVNKYKQFRPSGRSRFGKSIVISAPVATGAKYGGSKMVLAPSRRNNMNCTKMSTRQFMGTVQVLPTSGATNIMTSSSCGCSWFFQPNNGFYWPTSAPIVSMARMYQNYYINNVSVELESSYQPGNTVPYKTYFASFDDPNIGESYISGYDSVGQVTPTQILEFPNSRSFPTWEPKVIIPIPKRFYAGKKYVSRATHFDAKTNTSSGDNVATNKQEIAFGFFLNIAGAVPTSLTNMYDLFIRFDVEFCELAPIQLFDNTGSSTLLKRYQLALEKEKKHEGDRNKSVNRFDEFETPISVDLEEIERELEELTIKKKILCDDDSKSKKGSRK